MLNLEELKFDKNNKVYQDGYRIVYFYENGNCSIGEFCKTIEGFMIGFAESNPIIEETDIPKFISTKDLLSRSLNYDKRAVSAAIYKTDGTLIDKIDNEYKKRI